nr:hypothetical protein [Actinomycetota bacterium]
MSPAGRRSHDASADRRPSPAPRRLGGRALALTALVAVCAGAALALSGALDSLERQSVSTRFQLRKAPRPTEIVVVGI